MTKPKILMIRTDWAVNEYRKNNDTYGGIGYYRIVKPAQALKEFYDIDVIGKGYSDLGIDQEHRMDYIFNKYDMVLIRQMESPRLASDFLACGKHFKKPVLFDMDDNFLDIKPDNPAYEHYAPGSQNVIMTSTMLSLADGLIVSTQPLKDVYTRLNPNIDILPNFNDVKDWKLRAHKRIDKLVIGWAGSLTHDSDIIMVIPALKRIFAKYPHVEFEVLGGVELVGPFKEAFGEFRDRVHAIGGSPAWDGYNKVLSQMGWSIAIAPLVNDDFTKCKSHIKWMEYSMMNWPVVASKTYPYYEDVLGLKTIRHGETGLIAETEDDWVESLSKLIESVELRDKLAHNARDYIEQNWQWSQNVNLYRKVFDKYLNTGVKTS